jgi:hypothetical protein
MKISEIIPTPQPRLISEGVIPDVDIDALEALIDRIGLAQVMLALVHICGEKAEHIRTNWQPYVSDAEDWDVVSDLLISPRLSRALNSPSFE